MASASTALCLFHTGTRRCCNVESTSMTLIQRHNNVVCQVGSLLLSVWIHSAKNRCSMQRHIPQWIYLFISTDIFAISEWWISKAVKSVCALQEMLLFFKVRQHDQAVKSFKLIFTCKNMREQDVWRSEHVENALISFDWNIIRLLMTIIIKFISSINKML